jgi:hypothetical protein
MRNLGVRTNFDKKKDEGLRLVVALGRRHEGGVHDRRFQPAPGGGRAARHRALQYRRFLKINLCSLDAITGF